MNNQIGDMIIVESPYNNLVEINGERVYLTAWSWQDEVYVKHYGAKKVGDIVFTGMVVGTGEWVYYYLEMNEEIYDQLDASVQKYWHNLPEILTPLRYIPGNYRALGYKIDTKETDKTRLIVDAKL